MSQARKFTPERREKYHSSYRKTAAIRETRILPEPDFLFIYTEYPTVRSFPANGPAAHRVAECEVKNKTPFGNADRGQTINSSRPFAERIE